MQNSKIPVRTTTASSKRQVISDIQMENRPKIVQQAAKVAEKVQNATIKQSNPVAKKTTTMRDTGKDNSRKNELAQRKGKQASQSDLQDKSKRTLKKKEDAKQTNNQVLKEQNKKSDKTSSWQPSKVQPDKDFHLALKNRKPPKPITIPQIQIASTSNANQKKSENHSSQPDIEFEPDENCLKRILSGRELSPAALELPFGRAQSSFGGRFSNLHQPVRVDPYKTLLKSLENMASKSRRSSVRKQFYPGSPHLNTPNPYKTPKLASEITMRRLTDVKLREKSKSAKKVTFKLPDAGLAQKVSCQDRKVETDQLGLTDISEKSDISSQHSTPELDENLARLLPSTSNTSYIGETPSMSSFKNALRECHQDHMESIRKPDKKLTGILRSNTLTAFTHDERRNSNMNIPKAMDRKLRRSMSASELDSCPASKLSVLNDAFSKVSDKTELKKSSQVQSSVSSSNFHNFSTLRTINHSKLNDKSYNCKLSNGVENSGVETSSSIVAAALLARRESALLPRRLRRSMSASEVDLVSDPVNLHDRPLRSPSKIHIREESNQVYNSMSSYQFAKTHMLRTVSSPELRDKLDEMNSNIQNTEMKPGISKNNHIAADSCESEILANRSRKHRRSMSVSELNCFGLDKKIPKDKPLKSAGEAHNVESNQVYNSVASCQSVNTCNSKTQLSDRFFGVEASKVDSHAPNMQSTVRSNNISSSTMSRSSLNAHNFHNLRTSNSFTDLREKLSSITSTRKSEKNNPLLYSVNKNLNFKPNNLLLSSVRAADLRSSLYSAQRRNTIQTTYSPKLCTPCPVSLNPKSKAAQSSFSPEFLCRRSSNIISHAPIRTPLVMRQLAADELDNDDDLHLSPVRIKLDFEPTHQKEKDDSQGISKAYLQTFKTQQVITDCLADQECCIINSYADSFQHFAVQELSNPLAKTLEYGDEMHFVPIDEAD